MKTKYNFLLILTLVLASANHFATAQGEQKEQLVVPLSDPSMPGSLQVNLINGSIRVTGYSGNQVIVEVSARAAEKSEKAKEEVGGLKKITPRNGGLDLTVTEEKNAVKISTKQVGKSMNLHIKVPAKFKLNVSTINDGDIIVENVDGEFEIANVNGDISLLNVTGSAVANTINGALKASFKSIDSKSPMAFSTLNGNLDLTLPAASKFDVRLKSDRGEIFSDFDVDVDKAQPLATKSSKEGMYKVSLEDWVKGKVNGGGGEIMMKNMNGNIYVRKAK